MIRIMLVDDEQLILKGLRTIIKKRSKDYVIVGEALGGEKALQMVELCQPDIVITDICMPDISGLELIERMQALIPRAKFVVLSGHEEFSYAQEAIRLGVTEYLLKPVNSKKIFELLEKADKEFCHLQQQQTIEKLEDMRREVYECFYHGKETKNNLKQFISDKRYYTIMLIDYSSVVDEENTSQIKNLLDSYILKNNLGISVIENAEQIMIVKAMTSSEVHFIIQSLADQIIKQDGEGFKIYYSDTTTEIEEFPGLFMQTKQCQRMEFYHEDKKVVRRWSGEVLRPLTIDLIQNKNVQSIVNAMKQRDLAVVKSTYSSMINVYEEMCIEPHDVVRFIQGTLRIVVNQLIEDGELVALTDATLNKQIYHINKCKDKRALALGIESITETIVGYCTNEEPDTSSAIVNEVKKYIQNHYNEELSLSSLAEKVFINPKYLSDLFKKETGTTITAYLVYVRMENAKQLLKQLKYKIYEVAELVGYKSPKHFIKIFKRETGMTPSEYRNQ